MAIPTTIEELETAYSSGTISKTNYDYFKTMLPSSKDEVQMVVPEVLETTTELPSEATIPEEALPIYREMKAKRLLEKKKVPNIAVATMDVPDMEVEPKKEYADTKLEEARLKGIKESARYSEAARRQPKSADEWNSIVYPSSTQDEAPASQLSTADYDSRQYETDSIPLEAQKIVSGPDTKTLGKSSLGRQVSVPNTIVEFEFKESNEPEVVALYNTYKELDKKLRESDKAYAALPPDRRLNELTKLGDSTFKAKAGQGKKYGEDLQSSGKATDIQTSTGVPLLSDRELLFENTMRKRYMADLAQMYADKYGYTIEEARATAIKRTNEILGNPVWWTNKEQRDAKFAEGPEFNGMFGVGVWEYPGGAVVESTPAYALRLINAPINYLSGVVGSIAERPLESVKKARQTGGQPEIQEGTTLLEAAKISGATNVAKNRGFMAEYHDIAKGLGASDLVAGIAGGVGMGTEFLLPVVPGAGTLAKGLDTGLEVRRAGNLLKGAGELAELGKFEKGIYIAREMAGNILRDAKAPNIYITSANKLGEATDRVIDLDRVINKAGAQISPATVLTEAERLVGKNSPVYRLLEEAPEAERASIVARLATSTEAGRVMRALDVPGTNFLSEGARNVIAAYHKIHNETKGSAIFKLEPTSQIGKIRDEMALKPWLREAIQKSVSYSSAAKEVASRMDAPEGFTLLTKRTATASPKDAENILKRAKGVKDKDGNVIVDVIREAMDAARSGERLNYITSQKLVGYLGSITAGGGELPEGLGKYVAGAQGSKGKFAKDLMDDIFSLPEEEAGNLVRKIMEVHIDNVASMPVNGKILGLSVDAMKADAQKLIRVPKELRGNVLSRSIEKALNEKAKGISLGQVSGSVKAIVEEARNSIRSSYKTVYNNIEKLVATGMKSDEAIVTVAFDPTIIVDAQKKYFNPLDEAGVAARDEFINENNARNIMDRFFSISVVSGKQNFGNIVEVQSIAKDDFAFKKAKLELDTWLTPGKLRTLSDPNAKAVDKVAIVRGYLEEAERAFRGIQGIRVMPVRENTKWLEALLVSSIENINKGIADASMVRIAKEQGIGIRQDVIRGMSEQSKILAEGGKLNKEVKSITSPSASMLPDLETIPNKTEEVKAAINRAIDEAPADIRVGKDDLVTKGDNTVLLSAPKDSPFLKNERNEVIVLWHGTGVETGPKWRWTPENIKDVGFHFGTKKAQESNWKWGRPAILRTKEERIMDSPDPGNWVREMSPLDEAVLPEDWRPTSSMLVNLLSYQRKNTLKPIPLGDMEEFNIRWDELGQPPILRSIGDTAGMKAEDAWLNKASLLIMEFLHDHDIDVVRYLNKNEDAGSTSYIVINPSIIHTLDTTAMSKVSWPEVQYSRLERLIENGELYVNEETIGTMFWGRGNVPLRSKGPISAGGASKVKVLDDATNKKIMDIATLNIAKKQGTQYNSLDELRNAAREVGGEDAATTIDSLPNKLYLANSANKEAVKLVDRTPNVFEPDGLSVTGDMLEAILSGDSAKVMTELPAELVKGIDDELRRLIPTASARAELARYINRQRGGTLESGMLSALGAVDYAAKAFMSLRYNAMLKYRPRFHGVNFLTAPLIIHSTLGEEAAIRAVTDPDNIYNAGRILSPYGDGAAIVATTPDGLHYTANEVRNMLASSGLRDLPPQGMKIDRAGLMDIVERATKLKQDMVSVLPEATQKSLSRDTVEATKDIIEGIRWFVKTAPNSLATNSDLFWRTNVLLDSLRTGEAPEIAIAKAREALYDYGKMTEWEKEYISRYVLFYSFMRSSLVNSLTNLVSHPSRIAKQTRLVKGTLSGEEERQYSEPGTERIYRPDFMAARGAKSISTGVDKQTYATLYPNLPLVDSTLLMAVPVIELLQKPSTAALFNVDLSKFGERVDPNIQAGLSVLGFKNKSALEKEEMIKERGYIDPRHVLLMKMVPPVWRAFLSSGGVKDETEISRDAKPGETSINGRVYELVVQGTKGSGGKPMVNKALAENYYELVRLSEFLGTDLAVKDWTANAVTAYTNFILNNELYQERYANDKDRMNIELGVESNVTLPEFFDATTDTRLREPKEVAYDKLMKASGSAEEGQFNTKSVPLTNTNEETINGGGDGTSK